MVHYPGQWIYSFVRMTFHLNMMTIRVPYPSSTELIPDLKTLCSLRVNLRDIPASSFSKRQGPKGAYYHVGFELGFVFGPGGMEFKFIHKGKVIGFVNSDY